MGSRKQTKKDVAQSKQVKGQVIPLPKPATVFISHATTDQDFAELFSRHLKRLGPGNLNCFVAGSLSDKRIEPGKEWRESIKNGINGSDILVCLLTADSRKSAWVNYELGIADQLGIDIFGIDLDPLIGIERDHPISDRQWARPNREDMADVFAGILGKCGVPKPHRANCLAEADKFLRAIETEREANERVEKMEVEHLRFLRKEVSRFGLDAQFELERTPRTKEIHYMTILSDTVSRLKEGESFLAICGDKNLQSDAFVYMNKNVDAALDGVAVHRIYVEPKDGFKLEEKQIIDSHLHWSCEPECRLGVSIVVGENAERVRKENALPDGFGLVVSSGSRLEALMHFGLRNEDRRARRFDEALTIRVYQEMHASIAQYDVDKGLENWLLANEWEELQRHEELEYPEQSRSIPELARNRKTR